MPSVDVVAIFSAAEGSENELRSLLSTLVEPSRAESANQRYDLRQVIDARPARFIVLEQWESPSGFDEHRIAPHMERFRESVTSLLATSPEVLVLEDIKPTG